MSLEISDHPSDKRYVEQFRLARQLANDKKDSSKNVIIAFGCSFTDPYFRVDYSWTTSKRGPLPPHLSGGWKMWPEVFKDMLEERDNHEYHVLNFGRSGSGFGHGFESFLKVWPYLKHRIKFVLWGGTDFNRFEHHCYRMHVNLNNRRDIAIEKTNGKGTDYERYMEYGVIDYIDNINRSLADPRVIKWIMMKRLRLMTFIEDLSTSNGGEFLYYPLIEPFGGGSFYKTGGSTSPSWKIIPKYLQDLPFILDLKNDKKRLKHYVNLSINFSGTFWTSWSSETLFTGKKLKILDNKEWPNDDGHPDKYGQIDIANQVWKHYVAHEKK